MIVPITLGESYQIWLWARERMAAKPKYLQRKRGWTGRAGDNLYFHLDGIKGEYAVSKLFCLPFDNNPLPGGHGHQPDLTLPDGTTIQVKYRAQRGWDYALSSDNPDEFVSDIGILCWPAEEGDGIDVVGYVTRAYFIEHAKRVNYIQKVGGDRLALGSEYFAPISSLMKEHWDFIGSKRYVA